ncbi:TM2 domain-containing protein 1 [Trichoplax sp. H2]|uniref:TM2 domain-containing protein n=1 Tax=Trichoplax adhaerens TaxID=10228 RepID=B3RSU2_TRIAD|nr:hypothetical protein TRIADDRAFT_22634 [Trichoplax adhaerens]EDV27104.1 hypothetical protein TRIADDRAFT_22634 [Trichoplax adhaerens]RDD45843.1 TM2 domain-containing protein 1 [Trichoplax sp. H2]|eukprot:XP_002111100.1 hypothetical protein TRIADDRAFT_22634 [Trichoplax adhaerens]
MTRSLFQTVVIAALTYGLLILITLVTATTSSVDYGSGRCSQLPVGKYVCEKATVNTSTQTVTNCTHNNTVTVNCSPIAGVVCDGKVFDGLTYAFTREEFCHYSNGYSFQVALSLSVFLGMFGADRFYLGYPALGLLKLSTFGFFMVGQLLDVILIATQVVGPADGSFYQMNYYGPRLSPVRADSQTKIKASN